MPKVYECLIARSKITSLVSLDDDTLAFTTLQNGITLFDSKECDIKNNLLNNKLNSSVVAQSFSPNKEMFAFVNHKNIYILDIQTKELINTIYVEDEEVDIISFDKSSSYIIAGTKNGRVLQYRYNQDSLLSRLCSFPYNRDSIYTNFKNEQNYVSAFAFYENILACSGYGGAIFLIDIHTQANKNVITHHRTRVNTLCFKDEKTLLSGNDDGSIDITSLENIKSYKSINTPLSTIAQIILMPNPDYIMVRGLSNIISIVDIKNYKIIHSKYVEFTANIVDITMVHNELIIVALDNKRVVYIELPSVEKLKSFILHNEMEKAYKLIHSEPMLRGTHEHKMLEDQFENVYEEATQALINQNKSMAKSLLESYKDVASKQQKIRELFMAFDNFRRFHGLFLEKKYALAYAMASKLEPLKKTPQYHKMEQVFRTAFANAQRQVLKGNIAGAKALLFEYNAVISKKPIIQLIINQNEEFIEFLQAINKKDYEKIHKLIKLNKIFEQIPNYIALNEEIENKLKNIRFSIKSGEIVIAKKLLYSLEKVPHIKDEVEKLNLDCKYALVLRKAYKEDRFKACYEILDAHPSLKSTELGIMLERHWTKLIHKCEEFALAGNIRDIKKELGTLLRLESRRAKIGDLIRVSFQVRIKMLLSSKNFQAAETIIYTYLDIFGQDSEITQIMNNYEQQSLLKLAISQEPNIRPSRDSWLNSPLIMKS
jgi:hypothetical protein